MDQALCREQLAALLRDEQQQLEQLTHLLEAECGAIQANNLDALDERGTARSRAMGALLRIQDERRGMLSQLGYPDSLDGLENLLRWCDPGKSLLSQWRRCADLATRCRELNESNGVMVNARLRRVEGMLEVITARPPGATYNRDAGLGSSSAGRLLTIEA
jgi:flagellar biosynthesis/type III secretory pathway chaperone